MNSSSATYRRPIRRLIALAHILLLVSCSTSTKPTAPADPSGFRLLADQLSARINKSGSVFEFATAHNSNKAQSSQLIGVKTSYTGAAITLDGNLTLRETQTNSSLVTVFHRNIPLSMVDEMAVATEGETGLLVKRVGDAKVGYLTTKKSYVVVVYTSEKRVENISVITSNGRSLAPHRVTSNVGRVASFKNMAEAKSFAEDFSRLVGMINGSKVVRLKF